MMQLHYAHQYEILYTRMDAFSSISIYLCPSRDRQGKLQEEKSRAIEAEAALREGQGGCGAG